MISMLLALVLHAGPPPIPEKTSPPPAIPSKSVDELPAIKFDLKALLAPDSNRVITNRAGDHYCPNCHSGQWLVQYRQAPGWHSHKCDKCGTEFWHPNPQPVTSSR